ncbi:hypothetical protein F444_06959 [Phytophthora nicotianae P1976]|uniref:Uncharacterized protein n=1 Tax=Phytophthora nicotianae P1976 TaxID=1317066 RepID=A0A081AGB1_PHYNI|nr:hypothetical protein F444_06959 [Phytophthora nicotianae P1976]
MIKIMYVSFLCRWTTPNRPLKQVKQFKYEKFTTTDAGAVREKLRTHSERYREAVPATHLITNEMAGIENDEEMLKFVLNQWRNVRQIKRVIVWRATTVRASPHHNNLNTMIWLLMQQLDWSLILAQVKTKKNLSQLHQIYPPKFQVKAIRPQFD